jgi:ABC-type transport system involved in Fe-S cluster assembly fused permease/ATPase subunit
MLKDGNVVESGKHKELLTPGGTYSSLYQTRLKPEN